MITLDSTLKQNTALALKFELTHSFILILSTMHGWMD